MRRSLAIIALALVAAAAVWAWTLDHGRAKAQDRVSGGIDTLTLTMKASMLPVQQFDAH